MSIKKDFNKLDALFGGHQYVNLSDEQYVELRPLLQKMLSGGYIAEETEIDNARNVFQKTEQYKY